MKFRRCPLSGTIRPQWVFFVTKKHDSILSMSLDGKEKLKDLDQKSKIIFTSYSKKNFYLRSDISIFILKNGHTPVSPFMNFDYNLAGLVPKDMIRVANNTLITKCDELWVFGEVSDGVMVEIYLAKKHNKIVRYFMPTLEPQVFEEIELKQVQLEDISDWMWEWVQAGKDLTRWHPRLRFNKTYPLVYPAYSKRNFFWQMHISQFCLNNKRIPLNPFMLFRYFLGDTVPRESVYQANAKIVELCDELWSFGEVSDGVLSEIKLKHSLKQPVRYYKISETNPFRLRQISSRSVEFEEPELEEFRDSL